MNYEELAELLFPHITNTSEDYEALYPPRKLRESARVTRFAPSPTGFLHIGGLFAALSAKLTASSTGGIFYLRIEDTDKKREIDDGINEIIKGLEAFGVMPDEGMLSKDEETGDYGPYQQSLRREIYQCMAKELVKNGLAYPCFCSAEELDDIRLHQENEPIKGYFGKWAKCRDLDIEEIKRRIEAGEPWVLRLKSGGNADKKIVFNDIIKGKIEMPENIMDIVLLKQDGIPTYHFAHCVDDHFMRSTHIVRGDEWIASVPIHIQLFKYCGFKVPKYAHIAPIMKEEYDGESKHKRKLSKRKDPEASITFYVEEGYPKESVTEYLMTLANSNFEDWRRANKTAPPSEFPFNLKKMSASGALFDLMKLNDVSKNVISVFSAEKVYNRVCEWAEKYDAQLYALLTEDKGYAVSMFAIDRYGKKPRKDIAKWSEIKAYYSYFFHETYENDYTLPENISVSDAMEILKNYREVYSENDDKDRWFSKIKSLCEPNGFTSNVKEYKKNPDLFKGHVGDVSTIIRIAVTGRRNTPDLFEIMKLLGKAEVINRIDGMINAL